MASTGIDLHPDGLDSARDTPKLTLLPEPLTLLRICKTDLDLCAKNLLQLIFFNDKYAFFPTTHVRITFYESRKDHQVFSVTQRQKMRYHWYGFSCHNKVTIRARSHKSFNLPRVPSHHSLIPIPLRIPTSWLHKKPLYDFVQYKILDEESKKLFSAVIEDLQLPSQQWRAIEIFEGPQALNQTGHISRYAEPLARNHMDLIYLSTYNTDLILVKEDNVERAVESLEKVSTSSVIESPPTPPPVNGIPLREPRFIRQDQLDTTENDQSEEAHILAPLPSTLNLLNFNACQVSNIAHALLQLFLFPLSSERFFSYTSYGGEVTLIVEEDQISPLLPHLSNITRHEFSWNALHLEASNDGIDSSVVSYAAKVLAKNEVSIYYLSTMNDDYILVPKQLINMALDSLQTEAPPS